MKNTLAVMLLITAVGCASTPKYANTSTADLQLRHAQCVEFLEQKTLDLGILGDGGRGDRIKEKEEIERELNVRWQAGEKAAYLRIFEVEKQPPK